MDKGCDQSLIDQANRVVVAGCWVIAVFVLLLSGAEPYGSNELIR